MSTPHQRLHIRTMLYERDIPTARMTDDFVRYCKAAGIEAREACDIGMPLDAFLVSLTRVQAKALQQSLLTGEGVA